MRSQLAEQAEVLDHLTQAALSLVTIGFMVWMMWQETSREPVKPAWYQALASPPPRTHRVADVLAQLSHEDRAALTRDLARLERGEA